MQRIPIFLLLVLATTSVICHELSTEPRRRHKRTLSPFRNWASVIPPRSNSGVHPTPPPGSLPPRISQAATLPSQLPNAQYPIYKIHKYNGVHLKPVPLQELEPKNIVIPYGQQPIEIIKTLLNTDISTAQIKSLVELASHKDGMRIIMALIDSGIIKSTKDIKSSKPEPTYGPPGDRSLMASQFQLPTLETQLQYNLPNPNINKMFRKVTVLAPSFRPDGTITVSAQPPRTSYGFLDNSIKRSFHQILPFKTLPALPYLPEAQLFEFKTTNPFADQKSVVYNVKTVQHVSTPSIQDTFSNNNPIVVTYGIPDSEIAESFRPAASENHEIIVDHKGHQVNNTSEGKIHGNRDIFSRKHWSPSKKIDKGEAIIKNEDQVAMR